MSLPSYADVIERVAPSVVALKGARFPATGTVLRDRLVVTVAHVMGRWSEGIVTLHDGRDVRAVLKGVDRRADLAVVEVDADLPVPVWGGDATARTGDVVLALGRPTGLLRASAGIIASVSGAWRSPRGVGFDRYLDVDGALPPGFSGGPLVVGDGTVAGINTALVVRGGTTLPAVTVMRLVDAILRGESSAPGFLGAAVQAVRLSAEQQAVAGQESGLLVSALTDGGPAGQAGVHVSDVLLSLDGEALIDVPTLLAALGGRGGKNVPIVIARGAEKRTVDVALTSRSARHGC
jgi:S1-C subfamily serine protease